LNTTSNISSRSGTSDTFGNINQEKNNIEEKMKKLQETCISEGYTEDSKKEEIQMTQEWEARCQ
jgi:hypothetical protein